MQENHGMSARRRLGVTTFALAGLLALLVVPAGQARAEVLECAIERTRGEKDLLPEKVRIDTDPSGEFYSKVIIRILGGKLGDHGPYPVVPKRRANGDYMLSWELRGSAAMTGGYETSHHRGGLIHYSARYFVETGKLRLTVRRSQDFMAVGETRTACVPR